MASLGSKELSHHTKYHRECLQQNLSPQLGAGLYSYYYNVHCTPWQFLDTLTWPVSESYLRDILTKSWLCVYSCAGWGHLMIPLGQCYMQQADLTDICKIRPPDNYLEVNWASQNERKWHPVSSGTDNGSRPASLASINLGFPYFQYLCKSVSCSAVPRYTCVMAGVFPILLVPHHFLTLYQPMTHICVMSSHISP